MRFKSAIISGSVILALAAGVLTVRWKPEIACMAVGQLVLVLGVFAMTAKGTLRQRLEFLPVLLVGIAMLVIPAILLWEDLHPQAQPIIPEWLKLAVGLLFCIWMVYNAVMRLIFPEQYPSPPISPWIQLIGGMAAAGFIAVCLWMV